MDGSWNIPQIIQTYIVSYCTLVLKLIHRNVTIIINFKTTLYENLIENSLLWVTIVGLIVFVGKKLSPVPAKVMLI